MKKLLTGSIIILLSITILYAASGTPSTLRVNTDASNNLLVTGGTLTGTVTSSVFSNTRLNTDSLGNLLVTLTASTQPFVGPASGTCVTPSYTFSGDTNTGIGWLGADNAAVCAGGSTIFDWNATRILSMIPFTFVQSGELVATTAISITPAAAGKKPFSLQLDSHIFNSIADQYGMLGFNVDAYSGSSGITNSEPSWLMAFENDYYDGVNHNFEWYLNYNSADGTTVANFRPLYISVLRNNNSSHKAGIIYDVGDATGEFDVIANAVSAQAMVNVTSGLIQFNRQVNIGQVGLQGTQRFYSSSSSGTGAYGYFQGDNTNLGRVTYFGGSGSAATTNTFAFSSDVIPASNNARDFGTSSLAWRTIVGSIFQGAGTGTSVANVGANSCGTSAATIAGNQLSGVITVGATAGTQCRVTFSTAAPVARDCTVTDSTTTIATRATYVDTTNTDFLGAFVAGDKVTYICTVR
jgi:hypothetical protein